MWPVWDAVHPGFGRTASMANDGVAISVARHGQVQTRRGTTPIRQSKEAKGQSEATSRPTPWAGRQKQANSKCH